MHSTNRILFHLNFMTDNKPKEQAPEENKEAAPVEAQPVAETKKIMAIDEYYPPNFCEKENIDSPISSKHKEY